MARGTRRLLRDTAKIRFTSTASFARVLSPGNREPLRIIAERASTPLDEPARITRQAPSNLSRTLRTLEGLGLAPLWRGRIAPQGTRIAWRWTHRPPIPQASRSPPACARVYASAHKRRARTGRHGGGAWSLDWEELWDARSLVRPTGKVASL
ncbi:MAG: HVO_A0114 family putative DNA-binding protein [Acidiferrobacter sp.]